MISPSLKIISKQSNLLLNQKTVSQRWWRFVCRLCPPSGTMTYIISIPLIIINNLELDLSLIIEFPSKTKGNSNLIIFSPKNNNLIMIHVLLPPFLKFFFFEQNHFWNLNTSQFPTVCMKELMESYFSLSCHKCLQIMVLRVDVLI